MLINIFPPIRSLKNLIINVLLIKNKVNIKEIKFEIKNKYGVNVSYQGIHKILYFFKEEKIVEKEDHIWKINDSWLKTIKETFDNIDNEEKILEYNPEMKSISFSTIGKAFQFMVSNIESGSLKNNGEDLFITHVKNLAFFPLDKREREVIKKLAKNTKCYVLVENNNFLNKLCTKFLKSFGMKIYFAVPRSTPHTITIYGNTLINTYSSFNLPEFMTQTYQKIKNISNKDALKLFYSIKDDSNIPITFTFETNLEIVEQMKGYLLGLTKGKI